MTHINTPDFMLYFGSAEDNLWELGQYQTQKFLSLQEKVGVEKLFFLKQTHSATVFPMMTPPEKTLTIFEMEGDAVITREKNVGIGVVTADCLPVMLYDRAGHAVGIIHAGWRGLSKKIITETIAKMHSNFGTEAENLQVYLGPSADVCCYEVQQDFLSHFPKTIFDNQIIETRGEQFYFNPRLAGYWELLDNGVLKNNIVLDHAVCTICQPGFCSVRQQKEKAGRQPTIVFLR